VIYSTGILGGCIHSNVCVSAYIHIYIIISVYIYVGGVYVWSSALNGRGMSIIYYVPSEWSLYVDYIHTYLGMSACILLLMSNIRT
jgi:hypothetical protein